MSSRCFCSSCTGRIVSRKTFISHGRMATRAVMPASGESCDRVRHRERAAPPAPAGWEPHDDVFLSTDEDSDSGSETSADERDGVLQSGAQAGRQANGIGTAKLTKQEITLLFLDWITTYKATDKCAAGAWNILKAMVPPGADVPTFESVKNLLRRGERTHVRRYDLCPNDCIVYWDSKYLPVPYQHSHRTACPVCGEKRYVVDPADGAQRPAKMCFFFPIAPFVRSLYSRPDLVPFLAHDVEDGRPSGDITRSRGFAEKVRDNPHMNVDARNLGLVCTTDGVPYFDDQRRGQSLPTCVL